jgi:hypothetical protein
MTFRGILGSLLVTYYYVWLLMGLAYRRKCLRIERRLRNRERRMENLNELIRESDRKCISELRMCWGPSASEGPQKHDLTMFLEYNT